MKQVQAETGTGTNDRITRKGQGNNETSDNMTSQQYDIEAGQLGVTATTKTRGRVTTKQATIKQETGR